MNILQILPQLNVGGVETGTLDLSRYLVKLGHKSVVVSSGGELAREIEEHGAKHYQLPVNKKSIVSILKCVPKLVEIIRKEEIDIIHARSRAPAWAAFLAARKTGKVFITTAHGYYSKHFFSYVMGWAKKVICPSNCIARHMVDDLGVPYERVIIIARSVDISKFNYASPDKKRRDEFNVGIVGRITPLKGHLHFIKAMAKVSRQVSRLKIWIVGDAPSSKESYKEQIQVLVRRLGLWHCTQFLGTQRDIPSVMNHLDLLVLATTTHEAFGRVIIEAQAAGVPVVATQVGGVVDIIDHDKTGILVPAADPQAMAEAVLKVYKDKELARFLAENAYEKVKDKFNVELMAKNTISVYEETLKNFKVLIIKLGSMGDVILSSAAIRAIKEKFGVNYKVTLLTSVECKEVLMGCPYIDELLVADFKNKDKGVKGLLRLGSILRKHNFDIVIDLQNNRKSHILSGLSMALNRYGYDNKKLSFFLNHRIKDEKPLMDPVTHQFRILNMLGIELRSAALELWPSDEDYSYVDKLLEGEWLSSSQKLIGLNIAASSRWLTKNWPLENIARFCEEMSRKEIRVVLTGAQADIGRATALMGLCKTAKPINACGRTTINQLACLIKKCSVYISADSAPLHVAAAGNVPVIALFGPTDPGRHMSRVKDAVVIKKDLECSPCYKSKCRTAKCMSLISAEEVLDAVNRLLK
jgi:lipopolysaccharide heptosyltransferase II